MIFTSYKIYPRIDITDSIQTDDKLKNRQPHWTTDDDLMTREPRVLTGAQQTHTQRKQAKSKGEGLVISSLN